MCLLEIIADRSPQKNDTILIQYLFNRNCLIEFQTDLSIQHIETKLGYAHGWRMGGAGKEYRMAF